MHANGYFGLVYVVGDNRKVKSLQDKIADASSLHTISSMTEKPLDIERSRKLEGELEAIEEETRELNEKVASLKQHITELEAGNITETRKRFEDILKKCNELSNALKLKNREINQNLKKRVTTLEAEVETLRTHVNELNGELEGQRMQLEERLVNLQNVSKKKVNLEGTVTSL